MEFIKKQSLNSIFIYYIGTKSRSLLIKSALDIKLGELVNMMEEQNILQEELNELENWNKKWNGMS